MVNPRDKLQDLERKALAHSGLPGLLNNLERLKTTALVDALVQRRYVAQQFSQFCDILASPMRSRDGLELIRSILLEEYQPWNHRVAFVEELVLLGREREVIFSTPITPATNRAVTAMRRLAEKSQTHDDATRLCLLRFGGELLPGSEYVAFFNELQKRNQIDRASSRFLWPHIQYDLIGPESAGLSHAERFLGLIEKMLSVRTDWRSITSTLNAAARARAGFYGQFTVDV